MNPVVRYQLLDKANQVFRSVGVGLVHEEHLAAALDLSLPAFRSEFGCKAELIRVVTEHNLQRQRREHAELFGNLATPVERLLALLHHSQHELRRAPHHDYHVLRDKYPQAWELLQQHLVAYSRPLLTALLQDGVQAGQLRADLDAPFVAHVMLAQFSLVLDETHFPPDRANLAEVYRNIFFYYVRGLCTEEGARVAAAHLARM